MKWFGSRRHAIICMAAGVSLVISAATFVMTQRADDTFVANKSVSLSFVRDYASLAELRGDAAVVAVVTALSEARVSSRIPDVPTVDVALRIDRVLYGTANVGDTVTLVQVADPTGNVVFSDDLPAPLSRGRKYVVYLNRQFPDQEQMVLTGAVGAFQRDVDGVGYTRMGSANKGLPLHADERDFAKARP